MATKAIKLAKALLTKRNIHIAEEVLQKHFDAAITEKAKERIQELSSLLAMIQAVKAEAEK